MPDKEVAQMPDKNEVVVVNIPYYEKISLYGHITSQMKKLGYNPCDYSSLDLGFELPADWPVNSSCEITLAQLAVFAVKLDMRIYINNLSMEPHNYGKESEDEHGPGLPG